LINIQYTYDTPSSTYSCKASIVAGVHQLSRVLVVCQQSTVVWCLMILCWTAIERWVPLGVSAVSHHPLSIPHWIQHSEAGVWAWQSLILWILQSCWIVNFVVRAEQGMYGVERGKCTK